MAPAGRERSTVRFYTSNPGKVREVRAHLAPLGYRVLWGRRELVEPQSDTLEEVVRSKLSQLPRSKGGAVMVEDSGLFVRALGGFPGVYSAYVYRTLGPRALARLTPRSDRRATFRTVIGLREADGATRLFVGEAPGTIAPGPRGAQGFGFDPIFRPQGVTRTFAQMSLEEKGRRSHRGKAVEELLRYLEGRR